MKRIILILLSLVLLGGYFYLKNMENQKIEEFQAIIKNYSVAVETIKYDIFDDSIILENIAYKQKIPIEHLKGEIAFLFEAKRLIIKGSNIKAFQTDSIQKIFDSSLLQDVTIKISDVNNKPLIGIKMDDYTITNYEQNVYKIYNFIKNKIYTQEFFEELLNLKFDEIVTNNYRVDFTYEDIEIAYQLDNSKTTYNAQKNSISDQTNNTLFTFQDNQEYSDLKNINFKLDNMILEDLVMFDKAELAKTLYMLKNIKDSNDEKMFLKQLITLFDYKTAPYSKIYMKNFTTDIKLSNSKDLVKSVSFDEMTVTTEETQKDYSLKSSIKNFIVEKKLLYSFLGKNIDGFLKVDKIVVNAISNRTYNLENNSLKQYDEIDIDSFFETKSSSTFIYDTDKKWQILFFGDTIENIFMANMNPRFSQISDINIEYNDKGLVPTIVLALSKMNGLPVENVVKEMTDLPFLIYILGFGGEFVDKLIADLSNAFNILFNHPGKLSINIDLIEASSIEDILIKPNIEENIDIDISATKGDKSIFDIISEINSEK